MMLKTRETVYGYEIIEQLGAGGFSEIYKARDRDGGLVTLKLPMPSLIGEPSTYERFRREYAIGQKVNHPAIPRAISMLDNGSNGPCLVFQFVEGRSLRNYLNERMPLQLAEALDIAVQLAEVLEYLHENGIYHRDLKPENIIVDAAGMVHLIDFGSALLEGARRVTWGSLWNSAVGTADYMAPEQIQGKRGDARTDIYALGIILYEMLTGTVPFNGDNPLAVMNQHLTATPPLPRKLEPTIPSAVEAIVLKAIRRDREERYESAEALRYDLEHYAEMDTTIFTLGPEKKGRGVVNDREIWIISLITAVAFLALAALIVLTVIMVKRG